MTDAATAVALILLATGFVLLVRRIWRSITWLPLRARGMVGGRATNPGLDGYVTLGFAAAYAAVMVVTAWVVIDFRAHGGGLLRIAAVSGVVVMGGVFFWFCVEAGWDIADTEAAYARAVRDIVNRLGEIISRAPSGGGEAIAEATEAHRRLRQPALAYRSDRRDDFDQLLTTAIAALRRTPGLRPAADELTAGHLTIHDLRQALDQRLVHQP